MASRSAAAPARPLFLLHGADGFRARLRAFDLVRRLARGEDATAPDLAALPRRIALDDALGVTRLSGRAASGDAVVLSSRSEGLFATAEDRRVVFVEDAEALAEPARLHELPAETAVVLLASGPLAAARGATGLAQVVRDLGGAVEEFKPLEESEVEAWLGRRATHLGVALEPSAAAELARAVGADLERADQELEKLAAYAAGERVRAEDVRALVPGAVEAAVFDLTGAVLRHDVRRAIALLERLLDGGEPPLRLLGLLVWQFRVLLAAAGARGDAELERAAAQLGLSRGALLRSRRVASSVRPSVVARAYESLYAADVALKAGFGRQDQQHLILQLLVLDLCGVEGADPRPLADAARAAYELARSASV